ncbi:MULTISPECIES: hypothetical protein [Fusobacterium]|uniref:hypothetical protein n=1 Tax=Fusobacterium TaxID=848 RepID=UPI0025C20DBF|nr:hypothetical protein [Fusobacterium sp.]MDD7410793.1 hypothetical protein [Fusobacteriaceae bacterium]MDY5304906.1 hypothetical protein [Fusobacterium gastrosuis]MCI5724359.1 hypothetical protein [Fusobacterium sp.]MCI7223335.1 hypothetical protein [Fusobacterium sp.]MDY5713146.1 hypothetical protein [Fusobacterium gastrosuis]
MKKIKFTLIFLPLILGILIYLLYRSRNLFYYNLIHYFDVNGYVVLARQTAKLYRKLFPTWSIYSLPDGLWLFSTGAAFLLCRNHYLFHAIWYSFIYLLMIATEYVQKFYGGHGTAIGTYDKKDIVAFTAAYISINVISFILNKLDNQYKYKSNLKIEFIENISYTIIFLIIGLLPSML